MTELDAPICDEMFYVCDDSTDEAEHFCVLDPDHDGDHKCKCGVTGDC